MLGDGGADDEGWGAIAMSMIWKAILEGLVMAMAYCAGVYVTHRRFDPRTVELLSQWKNTIAVWKRHSDDLASTNEKNQKAAVATLEAGLGLLTGMSSRPTTFHEAFTLLGHKLRSSDRDERRVAEVAAAILCRAYVNESATVSDGISAAASKSN